MYDVAIVGGGIAGLYTAYLILSKNPHTKLLLLEKNTSLGGRIETHTDRWMTVEAGAGRFAKHHYRLFRLLKEFDLEDHIVPIGGGGALYVNTRPSHPSYTSADMWRWIRTIHKQSKTEPAHKLQNMIFLDYAKEVLRDESKVKFLLDSFGYSTELVVMNAHDSLAIITGMSPTTPFYVLSGGLSQLVDRMVEHIRQFKHLRILCKKEIISATVMEDTETYTRLICRENATAYMAKQCVFALPQPVLSKLACFRPIRSMIDQVTCRSLCRIYSVFPPNPDTGKVWFADKSKMTVANDLRMIIPIDTEKGIIMTSYTDNEWADKWNRIHNVDAKLVKDLVPVVGYQVPKPLHTNVFYWKYGVGYWTVGADSHATSQQMIHPFADRSWYICGENYSEKNQQWVEGALETSERVARLVSQKN